MRIVYIAHPIGGDVEQNLKKIRAIVRHLNLTEPHTVPFAPYYVDVVSLDDAKPEERARGIKNGLAVLARPGAVDELRLFGDTITSGMRAEVTAAHAMRIPIVCDNQEIRRHLEPLLKLLDGVIAQPNSPK